MEKKRKGKSEEGTFVLNGGGPISKQAGRKISLQGSMRTRQKNANEISFIGPYSWQGPLGIEVHGVLSFRQGGVGIFKTPRGGYGGRKSRHLLGGESRDYIRLARQPRRSWSLVVKRRIASYGGKKQNKKAALLGHYPKSLEPDARTGEGEPSFHRRQVYGRKKGAHVSVIYLLFLVEAAGRTSEQGNEPGISRCLERINAVFITFCRIPVRDQAENEGKNNQALTAPSREDNQENQKKDPAGSGGGM